MGTGGKHGGETQGSLVLAPRVARGLNGKRLRAEMLGCYMLLRRRTTKARGPGRGAGTARRDWAA